MNGMQHRFGAAAMGLIGAAVLLGFTPPAQAQHRASYCRTYYGSSVRYASPYISAIYRSPGSSFSYFQGDRVIRRTRRIVYRTVPSVRYRRSYSPIFYDEPVPVRHVEPIYYHQPTVVYRTRYVPTYRVRSRYTGGVGISIGFGSGRHHGHDRHYRAFDRGHHRGYRVRIGRDHSHSRHRQRARIRVRRHR